MTKTPEVDVFKAEDGSVWHVPVVYPPQKGAPRYTSAGTKVKPARKKQ